VPDGENQESEERRARQNLAELLQALREERSAIEQIIEAFERLAADRPKREGRPPKTLNEANIQTESAK